VSSKNARFHENYFRELKSSARAARHAAMRRSDNTTNLPVYNPGVKIGVALFQTVGYNAYCGLLAQTTYDKPANTQI
jgi:hypothetical protein